MTTKTPPYGRKRPEFTLTAPVRLLILPLMLAISSGCDFYTRIEAPSAHPNTTIRREYLSLLSLATQEHTTLVLTRDTGSGQNRWRRVGRFAGEVLQTALSEDGVSLVAFYRDNVRIYRPPKRSTAQNENTSTSNAEELSSKTETSPILLRPPRDHTILAGTVWVDADGTESICPVWKGPGKTEIAVLSADGRIQSTAALLSFPEKPLRVKVCPGKSFLFVTALPRKPNRKPVVYKAPFPPSGTVRPVSTPEELTDTRYFSSACNGDSLFLMVRRGQGETAETELWKLGKTGWERERNGEPTWPRLAFRFKVFELYSTPGGLFLYATNTQDVLVQERVAGHWRPRGTVSAGTANSTEAIFILILLGAAFLVMNGAAMAANTLRGNRISALVETFKARHLLRAEAFVFDSVTMFTLMLLLGMLINAPESARDVSVSDITAADLLLFFAVQQAVTLLYYTILEGVLGRSPGKILAGLSVVKADGTPAERWRLVIRNIFRVVDFLPPFAPAGMMTTSPLFGILSVVITPNRQRFGDMVAGTFVVERRPAAVRAVTHPPKIVLASTSVQRARILKQFGYLFDVIPPEVEEPPREKGEAPSAYARRLARMKNEAVRTTHLLPEGTVVVSADTVVAVGEEVMGKPSSPEEARKMLELLASTPHRVITALCLSRVPGNRFVEAWDSTIIELSMTPGDIERYIESGKWEGSAGAYSIEENDPFIKRIEGSRSNVEGFPIELFQELYSKLFKEEEDAAMGGGQGKDRT